MKQKSLYILGTVETLGFLVISAFLYQWIFIDYVRVGKYVFLGSGWFFLFEMSLFPIINTVFRKPNIFIGNVVGIVLYFVVVTPIVMILSEGH